ncbi:MAG TPA: pyridoxamine 5'-phosphate oxidase family protein [Acidimicrobiales bacterium]|nr:pyridoxamine 5'-phosphate oxidase family protein [Acidimicrobiales bacterium]
MPENAREAASTEITGVAGLREVYRPPSRPALAKQIDHLDANCRAFVARSPFVTLATADAEGRCDVSPRGGPPGFVRVLDEHALAIPDLSGNNRLDSLQNILSGGGVGLLFMIPGLDETLRVNGRGTVTTDPAVLDRCPVGDVVPRVAVCVTVDEAYIHCAKALRRSRLWDPDGRPDLSDMPSVACMLRDHYGMPELDTAAVERRLEESYARTLWRAGGDTPAITGD